MNGAKTRNARARIAWISGKDAPSTRLSASLTLAGYTLVSPVAAAEIALIDVRHQPLPANDVRRFLRLYATPAYAGRVIMASPDLNAAQRTALRRLGDVVYHDRNSEAALRRKSGSSSGVYYQPVIDAVRTRLRLGAVAEETGERLKTLSQFARTAALTPVDGAPAVLVAGGPGAPMLSAISVLRTAGARVTAVFNAAQTLRAMDHDDFDAAVFLPPAVDGVDKDALTPLARVLSRHQKHRRTPIISCGRDHPSSSTTNPGVGVTYISSDHADDDLAPITMEAAIRARTLSSLRTFLDHTSHHDDWGGVEPKENDVARGAGYFVTHADRLLQRAHQTGRPISLIAVTALNETAGNDGPFVSARHDAVRRTLDMAAHIVRAEDVVTQPTDTMLVALAPATSQSDARKIAERLEGFIAAAVPRDFSAPIVSTAIECQVDARIEENMSRLLKALKTSEPNIPQLQRR